MTDEYLVQLAQLRAVMREIHTSGEDTQRMAGCLNYIDQVIQALQTKQQASHDQVGETS